MSENKLICVPFDYNKYCNTPYYKEITALKSLNSKKERTYTTIDISETPIKIFLIYSNTTEFNRDPVIICKGRRVCEVSKIDQFRTLNKSSIWSNGSVTGYIDATGVLEPTPTRKELILNKKLKAFCTTLLLEEEEILKYINSQTTNNSNAAMKGIEEFFNSVLKDFLSCKNTKKERATTKVVKQYRIKGYGTYLSSNNIVKPGNSTNGKGSAKGSKSRRKRDKDILINLPIEIEENSVPEIIIDNTSQPQMDLKTGQLIRSVERNSKIIIFQKHKEFKDRMPSSRSGKVVFTESLANYLSLEAASHLIKRLKGINKIDNEFIIRNYCSLVYELERKLKAKIGERF